MQAQIEALERLAALDAELTRLHEELARERTALLDKKTHLEELEQKLARSQGSISEMDRMRGELIQEMRQMSVQLEKSREKLARCRTEREANAAQREVEELRKLFRDRELEIDKLGTLVDQARGELESTQGEKGQLASELGESEGAVATRLNEVEAELAEKNERRKEVVAQVTPVLYRRYELVRKRKGTAIAFTHTGTCSACHMTLPPQLYQQLKRGTDFGQCPSCNRILYFRTDPPPPEARAAESAETPSSSA
jgi:predicted  nucleic acid-binding Zn-ribbon protein